jgi:hypothetical protein
LSPVERAGYSVAPLVDDYSPDDLADSSRDECSIERPGDDWFPAVSGDSAVPPDGSFPDD